MDKFVALLLAKKESKRLPNKNTLDFNGKPMFLVNTLKCLNLFDKVYVSSDDHAILTVAYKHGAIPIKRDKDLCGDTPNIPVYQHALERMGDVEGIIAVQVNSPTIDLDLIEQAKLLMEHGCEEVMTCDEEYKIYGSIWGIRADKLRQYGDPYNPKPQVLLVDPSVDIHTQEDLNKALCQK